MNQPSVHKSTLFAEFTLTKEGLYFHLHFSNWVLNPLILLCFVVSIFSSCNQTGASNGDAGNGSLAEKDLPLYSLPNPTPVNTAEASRIRAACQLWYDSTLGLKTFNGGMIVAKNGNIIFEKYSGSKTIPGYEPITENTPLHIASVTKTFTGMAVLKLWQDGKLNIDDEVIKYLPGFNYPGVTIRTLLNHRSGIPNYLYFFDHLGCDKSKMANNTDVFDFMNQYKGLMMDIQVPNTHFSYNNSNYALLALIIEKVSKKSFPAFMQHEFFKPLQMHNSYVFTIKDSVTATPSYDWKGRWMRLNHLDLIYGDKNIYTTPQDLLIWDRALKSGLIFKPETLQEAYAAYSNEKPGIKNYGLGWRMNIYPNGKKIIFHNGWWHGSNSVFIRLLDEDATIIVIGNKFTRSIYGARSLCNLFGEYFMEEEEEENGNGNTNGIDSFTAVKPGAVSFPQTKRVSKKDSLLMNRFKDQNKVKTGRE